MPTITAPVTEGAICRLKTAIFLAPITGGIHPARVSKNHEDPSTLRPICVVDLSRQSSDGRQWIQKVNVDRYERTVAHVRCDGFT